MKVSADEIRSGVHSIPDIQFDEQQLTSYAGVIIFQKFFREIGLRARLQKCFARQRVAYGLRSIVLTLIVHFILGNRRIRDLDYYRNDPVVKRLLGLNKLPDVSTISRTLGNADEVEYKRFKDSVCELVQHRICTEKLARLTLDFDGSVLSTQGHAEGTAVGFNKKKKGARSLYPLLCSLAQTGQIFNWLDRSGNVHDSNGAPEFMRMCFELARKTKPDAKLEARTDCAFFSDEIISMMNELCVEFTSSVPFERFPELKSMIESRQRWYSLDETWSYFEKSWKPKSWKHRYRFLFMRQKNKKSRKGPLQLDLFEPIDHEYTYKVIITNKTTGVGNVLRFHNGRGTQEALFAECKQHAAMDYIPFKRKIANQFFLGSSIMAHNLGREIQMSTKPRDRATTTKRAPLWIFDSLGSLCRRLIQRAGRLTNRSGRFVLTMNGDKRVQDELLHYLDKAS